MLTLKVMTILIALISSFQAPRSIHDRVISSNLNQHNNTIFDSNQQHDMYKSSTADSYERLLKKTSRMIQSIISLYDTPPQATEQKSSASSLSSSLSSTPTTTTTTTTTDRDDYNLRVDDLVAEGLDHHCDWNILPYILQSCRQSLRSLVLPITISNNTPAYTNLIHISTISDVSNASMDEVIEGDIKLAIWYFRSAVNPRRYIHLDDMRMSGSIGGRHSNTHGDDHVDDDYGGHHHHDDCDGLVHSSPINNEDLHSYIDTTSTREGILEMMSYELMQKKRLSRLWSIICPHINAYCKERLNQLSRRLR